MAIDVGSAAIDRASYSYTYYGQPYTLVNGNNPANATGTLDTVQVYFNSAASGNSHKIGTFTDNGSNSLTCHDAESIGEVTAGSAQEFTGLSIDISSGEYIGIDARVSVISRIETDSTGGNGFWYKAGETHCDPEDTDTFDQESGVDGILSIYGTGTEGGGATEKFGADTGAGADARASGNPVAAVNGSETGSGADSLQARDIALPEAGSGVDALVSLQTPSAKTSSDAGSGADAFVSLQIPQQKTSSDAGSGVEAMPVYYAVLAGVETGTGVEAFIARLLATAENGYSAEASVVGGDGEFKELLASELGEGWDALTAKIETPTKGGGMRLWT